MDQLNGLQVLIVEDDPASQLLMNHIVFGIDALARIAYASSLVLAKSHLRTRKIDLVVADYFLTGIGTGLDLWHHCREHHAGCRFLLTSGLDEPVIRRLVEGEKDPFPYVQKPFRVAEFKQAVAGLLVTSAGK